MQRRTNAEMPMSQTNQREQTKSSRQTIHPSDHKRFVCFHFYPYIYYFTEVLPC